MPTPSELRSLPRTAGPPGRREALPATGTASLAPHRRPVAPEREERLISFTPVRLLRRAGLLACLVAGGVAIGSASPAAAQLGGIEALAARVSDVSFYGSTGGLLPAGTNVEGGAFRMASWGIELLFEVGGVREPTGEPAVQRDSVELRWKEVRVERSGGTADTTYFYAVEAVKPVVPMRDVWTFEFGIGYGQVVGFAGSDPAIDLRGAVRDLPAVSLYASYEPLGGYMGLRSGFMRLHGLQAFDAEGKAWAGSGESFLAAALVGQSVEAGGLIAFLEAAYSVRYFPSVQWSGGPIPAGVPRVLNLSGWSVGAGLQFGIGR